MKDILIVLMLALILCAVLLYMKKEKKRGVKCIGCPDSQVCAKRLHGDKCKK